MPRTNLKICLWSQIHLAPLRDQQGNLMRIIGVQGRLEEEPGDGLEELMAKQCVVTETCDAESLRTSAVLLAATGPAAKKIAATDTEPPVDRKGMTAAEVLALQADISRADSLFASQGTSRLPQAPSRAKAKAARAAGAATPLQLGVSPASVTAAIEAAIPDLAVVAPVSKASSIRTSRCPFQNSAHAPVSSFCCLELRMPSPCGLAVPSL